MTLHIQGSSDDLIEVTGDFTEEFYAGHDETGYVVFSDGTILKLKYEDDALWHITRLSSGSASFDLKPGDVETDTNDVATLTGDIRWVAGARKLTFHSIKSQ